jgi:hypothetical protein
MGGVQTKYYEFLTSRQKASKPGEMWNGLVVQSTVMAISSAHMQAFCP